MYVYKMKKIIFVFITLIFSSSHANDEFIALKGIKEFAIEIPEIENTCGLDKDFFDREIKYQLSITDIVIDDNSDISIYVYPYLFESGNGIMTLCSGMIIFQVYGISEASFVWNNPLEGPFILYEYYIGAHATDYLEFKNYMASGFEDLIKDFVIAWYSVN